MIVISGTIIATVLCKSIPVNLLVIDDGSSSKKGVASLGIFFSAYVIYITSLSIQQPSDL